MEKEKKDLENIILFISVLMMIYGSCVILRWGFYIISGLIRYFTWPYSNDIIIKIIKFMSLVVIKFGYYIFCGVLGRCVAKKKEKYKATMILLAVFLVAEVIMAVFEFRWTIILECILPILLIYYLKKGKTEFN